jgi:hypothetical protein
MQATILQSHADLAKTVPGPVYVVHSGTEAYFPVMGYIEVGAAELLGEIYDERGRQVTFRMLTPETVARVFAREQGEGGAAARRSITIGPEFFVTALKDYDDWPIKWWREAIQNAVDAGGTRIEVGAIQNADGTFTVYCDDNGGGMDEDTLINKFLVLGGTTKVLGSGAAGGFGKAKELLLLPWISWQIHSRGAIVRGAGIDYSVSQGPARTGTRLEVVMPADKKTDGAIALAFIQRCNLPNITFVVDGKKAKADLSGGDLVASVPGKADLFYIKSKDKQSDLYVRARGLYMFSRYIGEVPGFIVAELTAPSIEILTANRDGFRDWQTRQAIDSYAERIAKDNRSALRASQGLIRQKFIGSGKFRARQAAADLLEQIGPTQTGPAGTVELSTSNADAIVSAVNEYARQRERQASQEPQAQIAAAPPSAVAMAMLDQRFLGPDHLEAAVKQLVWEPDWFLINEVEGFKLPKKLFPETMTPTILKLAKSWVELVRFVMMQLGSDMKFGVGFIVSEDTAAAAVRDEDNEGRREDWVLLNPYKDVRLRDETWRPAQDADLKWLYAAAIHECTHVADGISYHDESFAAALTRNMARCADGFRKIRQIVGGIRMRGGIEAD